MTHMLFKLVSPCLSRGLPPTGYPRSPDLALRGGGASLVQPGLSGPAWPDMVQRHSPCPLPGLSVTRHSVTGCYNSCLLAVLGPELPRAT